ncbi:MAG: hypothetical protein K9W44_00235 [Candidatus Lokiarchaeota archaeon]|nr:hypothetical protein [Candidatus Harpocratesius repetitus]
MGKYSWCFVVLTLIIQIIVVISNFKAMYDAKVTLDLLSPDYLSYNIFKTKYKRGIALARFAIIWAFVSAVVMAGLDTSLERNIHLFFIIFYSYLRGCFIFFNLNAFLNNIHISPTYI